MKKYIYMIMSASERRRKPQGLKIYGKLFTGMSSFKYLGNVINNGSRNDNCVKERMQAKTGFTLQILAYLKAK
jgi:hypothetical protein